MNIVVIDKNVTEVVFNNTVRSHEKVAGEQKFSLMIKNAKETDKILLRLSLEKS